MFFYKKNFDVNKPRTLFSSAYLFGFSEAVPRESTARLISSYCSFGSALQLSNATFCTDRPICTASYAVDTTTYTMMMQNQGIFFCKYVSVDIGYFIWLSAALADLRPSFVGLLNIINKTRRNYKTRPIFTENSLVYLYLCFAQTSNSLHRVQ